jgi:hypothetical protein
VRAGEVPACSTGQQRQLDAVAACDPLDDLVDGPVSTDGDEQRRALVCGFPRQVPELSWAVGEDRLAAQTGCAGGAGDLRPTLPGLPVRRRWVDQEDGVDQWPAVIVRRPSSVIWSTAARISSSEIRTNSPSTTTSLTVSRQPA